MKTRTVRGSDFSPAIALSEDKDILSNCNTTLQKMILYNPNVDLVNDNEYTKYCIKKLKKMSIKGRNSVANLRKMMIYNPNIDLVIDNVYTNLVKFCPFILKILNKN